MTFDESLVPILTGHALIGSWLIVVGLVAWSDPASRRPATFALAGGAGLVATAASIATSGMGSPVALVGFIAGIIGTTGFYALLGRRPAP
jgi:CHASE2 domain-containing sensor protein